MKYPPNYGARQHPPPNTPMQRPQHMYQPVSIIIFIKNMWLVIRRWGKEFKYVQNNKINNRLVVTFCKFSHSIQKYFKQLYIRFIMF